MATEKKAEQFEFQSEVKQLLDILVYSLYKHKEVFLRELVSNAVDALNKVQFQLLTETDLDEKDSELKINIDFDKKNNKLIVEDSGIGMTKDEIIENIGTIAHSGTVDFLKKVSEAKEENQVDMIGKFGVGFYASFMVAEEIHLYTKSYKKGSKGYVWKSQGTKDYSIEESDKKTRGTRIELILKKDEEKEFLEEYRIKNILSKHSKFVPFTIYVGKDKIESSPAIWTQPKSSLKKEDYDSLYKFLENSQEEPETYIHLSSDAPVQFNAILYIPKTSFEKIGLFKATPGVDIYSKKIMIQKESKDIMPEYLRFVKGVIDSEDIPLNISREDIQNNIKIDKIKKHVLKKLFDHLNDIKKKDFDKYKKIWDNFMRNFKEGITSDFENKDRLASLLLFNSSVKEKTELIDFQTYIDNMQKDQSEIYYITGMDLDSLEKNPALEIFKKKELNVLYLTDPVDEIVLDHLREYEGKKFKAVSSADLKLDEKEKADDDKDLKKDADNFAGYLKTIYGEKVADVKVSERLVDSPCILVSQAEGPSVQMEKMMKMMNKDYAYAKRVFEINQNNDLIKELIRIHQKDPASEELKTLSNQLLDNMMLREGVIDNIDTIIPQIQDIMLKASRNIQ